MLVAKSFTTNFKFVYIAYIRYEWNWNCAGCLIHRFSELCFIPATTTIWMLESPASASGILPEWIGGSGDSAWAGPRRTWKERAQRRKGNTGRSWTARDSRQRHVDRHCAGKGARRCGIRGTPILTVYQMLTNIIPRLEDMLGCSLRSKLQNRTIGGERRYVMNNSDNSSQYWVWWGEGEGGIYKFFTGFLTGLLCTCWGTAV